MILAAFVLAEVTPLYVVNAAPQMRTYLMHPMIFISQAIPFAVCALLWLPWKSASTAQGARILAVILFAITVAFVAPSWWSPGKHSGDMVGLGYIMGSIALTSVVLTGSFATYVVLKFQVMKAQASRLNPRA